METPPLPSPAAIQSVRTFIRDHWNQTIARSDPGNPRDIPLPVPFVVPTVGHQFHRLFYWDTYFACYGLIADGLLSAARSSAECFMHLLEHQGFIPNSATVNMNRSQPPVASLLFRLVYAKTGDQAWLQRACAALEKEHAFWEVFRSSPLGLAHYGHHTTPADLDNFYWTVRDRIRPMPGSLLARHRLLAHLMAEAESGSDFSPRFAGRCLDFCAVELNCLLHALEKNIAWMHRELGLGHEACWEDRAARRRQLLHQYCWNEADGWFYHYDYVRGSQLPMADDHHLFVLFCGVATPQQAARMVSALARLERPFGLTSCEPGARPPGQNYQWDDPNAWPPMQMVAMDGLLAYGFHDAARRIAAKYLVTVTRTFEQTGNLWEKYNAHTGSADVVDEYKMPAMLGWTAGAYLRALEIIDCSPSSQRS